jgi:hypothetical protein
VGQDLALDRVESTQAAPPGIQPASCDGRRDHKEVAQDQS